MCVCIYNTHIFIYVQRMMGTLLIFFSGILVYCTANFSQLIIVLKESSTVIKFTPPELEISMPYSLASSGRFKTNISECLSDNPRIDSYSYLKHH